MTAPENADAPVPSWWNPSGDRKGRDGFGAREDGRLRQSEQEALAWATAKSLTPSAAGLKDDEIEPKRIYSDGVSHEPINANFYDQLETPINKQLRSVLSRVAIPDPVIVGGELASSSTATQKRGYRLTALALISGRQRAVSSITGLRSPAPLAMHSRRRARASLSGTS